MWEMIRGAAAPVILGVIASMGLSAPAGAAPVTYQVGVNPINGGPFAGQSLSGTFTFDDSMIPVGGTGLVAFPTLLDLSINFGTLSFDETTVSGLDFDFAAGVLVDFFLGGNVSSEMTVNQFTDDFFLLPELFVYSTAQSAVFTTRGPTVSFSLVPVAVPEPATLALFGAGLAGLGWITRKRKAA